MKPEGWEEITFDENISSILRLALRGSFGASVAKDDKQVDLELLDLAINGYVLCITWKQSFKCYCRDGGLVVLISYAGAEDESSMAVDMRGVRRIYALAHLSRLDETFKVESVKSVPYQSVCIITFVIVFYA